MSHQNNSTVFHQENQLRLYSITEAASILHIGKFNLYNLMDEGKIGYIRLGKRKKFTQKELTRYEDENTIRKSNGEYDISTNDIERHLHKDLQFKNRKNETDIFLQKLKKELK